VRQVNMLVEGESHGSSGVAPAANTLSS
jgi:hypothetical protein